MLIDLGLFRTCEASGGTKHCSSSVVDTGCFDGRTQSYSISNLYYDLGYAIGMNKLFYIRNTRNFTSLRKGHVEVIGEESLTSRIGRDAILLLVTLENEGRVICFPSQTAYLICSVYLCNKCTLSLILLLRLLGFKKEKKMMMQ